MSILMLTWEYAPNIIGGLGKHVTELTEAMGGDCRGQEQFDVHVLTPAADGSPGREDRSDRLHIHRVDLHPPEEGDFFDRNVASNVQLAHAARELASEIDFELIHVHDWLPATAGLELMHDWRIPLVATVHATEHGRYMGHLYTDLSRKIHDLESRLCREAWRVIVCSYFMRDSLMRIFDLDSEVLDVIPNGINIHPPRARDQVREQELRQLYAQHGEFLLLFVGRPTHEKGLHVLLDAMALIAETQPDARLLVAGRDSRKQIMAVQQRGLAGKVDLLGYVDDVTRNCLLRVANAAVFPSLYEPFGIVALEAMAAGCPVVVSDVGGLSEVVEHEVTGLTVYPNDPRSICWAVEHIRGQPDQARIRAHRATRVVKDQFNWARVTRRARYTYRTLIDYSSRVPA